MIVTIKSDRLQQHTAVMNASRWRLVHREVTA